MPAEMAGRGDAVFDDPQVVIGMVIGVIVVAAGTVFGVLDHRRRERAARGDGE